MAAPAGARIVRAERDAEVLATYAVMRQLRPHLAPEAYLPTIRRMMRTDGSRLSDSARNTVPGAPAAASPTRRRPRHGGH